MAKYLLIAYLLLVVLVGSSLLAFLRAILTPIHAALGG